MIRQIVLGRKERRAVARSKDISGLIGLSGDGLPEK